MSAPATLTAGPPLSMNPVSCSLRNFCCYLFNILGDALQKISRGLLTQLECASGFLNQTVLCPR